MKNYKKNNKAPWTNPQAELKTQAKKLQKIVNGEGARESRLKGRVVMKL